MKRKILWMMIVTLIISVTNVSTVLAQEIAQGEGVHTDQEASHEGEMTATEKAKLLVDQYGVTSVQYALIEDGKVTVSGQEGVYSKTENKALTKDTMYGIGSVSKVFTATAVMKLVEQGKINLDKPVTEYVPDFQMADERYKKITVRMLLNHSSGLMGSTYPSGFLLDDADPIAHDNFLKNLQKQRLKAEPGAFSVYCNDGYTLAEIVVERVSGMSYTEFLHMYITAPLSLDQTKTPLDTFERSQLAKVYYPGIENSLPTDTVNVIGAGGIYSTAEDLCRFAQIFMDNQSKSSSVLSKQSTAAMAAEEYKRGMWQDGASSMSYGLGWDNVSLMSFEEYGIQALEKGGDTLLSHGSVIVLPKQNMAAAVLSSGGTSTYDRLLAESLLMERLQEKGLLIQKQDNLQSLASGEQDVLEQRDVYNGYYANLSGLMKVEISEDGQLKITTPKSPEYSENYTYREKGIFTDKLGVAKVSFVKEDNEKIYLKAEGSAYVQGLGQQYSSQYMAQKVDSNPLSEQVAAAWQERKGKCYYKLDEKYSSQFYMIMMPAIKVLLEDVLPGYVGASQIEDQNKTKTILEIPGMMGRDLQEYTFFEQDGTEYMSDGSNLYVSEDAIPAIYGGSGAVSTIGQSGYANWYKVGDQAGKTLTVDVPTEGSFAVYDRKGSYVAASWADGKHTAVLPGNGMIVFAGAVGSQFKITIE